MDTWKSLWSLVKDLGKAGKGVYICFHSSTSDFLMDLSSVTNMSM